MSRGAAPLLLGFSQGTVNASQIQIVVSALLTLLVSRRFLGLQSVQCAVVRLGRAALQACYPSLVMVVMTSSGALGVAVVPPANQKLDV